MRVISKVKLSVKRPVVRYCLGPLHMFRVILLISDLRYLAATNDIEATSHPVCNPNVENR